MPDPNALVKEGPPPDSRRLTPLERRAFTAVTATLVGAPAPEAVCDAAAPFLTRRRFAEHPLLRLLLPPQVTIMAVAMAVADSIPERTG